jgi:hypothetical protein
MTKHFDNPFSAIQHSGGDPCLAERQLIWAMVERAWWDINAVISASRQRNEIWRSEKHKYAESAFHWFTKNPWVREPQPFTFQWCFWHLVQSEDVVSKYYDAQRIVKERYFAQ